MNFLLSDDSSPRLDGYTSTILDNGHRCIEKLYCIRLEKVISELRRCGSIESEEDLFRLPGKPYIAHGL